jgi:L-ribulose-5-phosphate 3-epimerase
MLFAPSYTTALTPAPARLTLPSEMNLQGHDIGVCSWSLQPTGMADLIDKVNHLELDHIQLALRPLLALSSAELDREVGLLIDSGLRITATMIGYPGEDYTTIADIHRTGGLIPDTTWPARKQLTLDAGALSKRLGVRRLSTHVGFIPPPSDPSYPTQLHRITELSKPLADQGVDLLMETGQEGAHELLEFLNNLRTKNFGVNFDPANMILYGSGDPIDAIKTLGKHIRHVHVKDARRSDKPGLEWGDEVAFGDGDVPHASFVAALKQIGYTGPLVIEREAGKERLTDVRAAIETLANL